MLFSTRQINSRGCSNKGATFTQPEEEEESNVCCEDGDMIN